MLSSRFTSQAGLGPTVTPRMMTATYSGQLAESSTRTVTPPVVALRTPCASASSNCTSPTSLTGTGKHSAPVMAAISRATPRCDNKSGRFGKTSRSRRVSASDNTSSNGVPGAASVSSVMMPSCSCPRPSSRGEQSIPLDVSPRIFRCSILRPPGMTVPVRANGYLCPATTFGAPHTTSSSVPLPSSTLVTHKRSEFG